MNESTIVIINYSILLAGLVISLSGLVFTIEISRFDRWNRAFFILLFSILVVYLGTEILTIIAMETPSQSFGHWAPFFMYINSTASSLIMPQLTIFIIKTASPRDKISSHPLFITVLAFWIIYMILLTSTWFTDYIYYFTPDNKYHRGPFYVLLLLPAVLIMGANIIALIIRRKDFSRREMYSFCTYIILPLIGMILQIFFYGILSVALCSSLASAALFVFILVDHVERMIEQVNQSAHQQANILALQMRPHFIYNTLTSIYYLCDQDPQKAKSTIFDFTNYLRANFSAVASDRPVFFKDELAHAKAYLAVETVRFDDRIAVEYDIPYTDFQLPALTLQPLVENAVKHGIVSDTGNLHILIKTVKKEGYVELIVENTGAAFGEYKNDDPGIALENIKQRLRSMCNGTFVISGREGGGTVVTIKIPD